MALQSQGLPPSGWTPANPMPMVESALYRQRLEVIAEKRRLQEQICGARRELEEEKLRVQRLKRKSLRERWLMDGTAEGPEDAEPEADPHSPQGQAQARIQHLEDSLFTLQSQLQLLQSASTGAQHKTSAWPTWRRQISRSLSQTAMEPGSEGKEDLEKRASLPVMPDVSTPEPSTSRIPKEGGEAATTPQEPKEEEVSTADTVEANGPCPTPTPVELEPTQNQVDTIEDRSPGAGDGVDISGGTVQGPDIVKVEWDGLRFLEESAREAPACTEMGKAKEQEVEEIVLEVIGDHQIAGDPELPEWMTKDRRVQEVEEIVLEAMKGRSMMEASELPEWVTKDRGIVEVVWEGLGGIDGSDTGDSEEMVKGETVAGSPASSGLEPKEQGSGRSPELGDQGEGSFIWVERVVITEDWEEVLVEESEGTSKESKEGEAGKISQPGKEEDGEKEQLGTEKEGEEEQHLETEKQGSEGETEEVLQKDGEKEIHTAEEVKGDEEQLAEGKEEEEKEERETEEEAGGEKQLEGEEEEKKQQGSKEEEEREREGEVEKETPEEKDPEEEKGPDSEEKGEQEQEMKQATQSEAGPEPQAEAATSAPGESQAPAPSLEQLPAPEAGPPERQPLLQPATRTVNPASRPVPTYTPAQRAEPPPDSEQASGSKQTCQCCVVM